MLCGVKAVDERIKVLRCVSAIVRYYDSAASALLS